MHDSVYGWVGAMVEKHDLSPYCSVLEVGSYDVNGSVRDLFAGPYIGVDMQAGPGVDRVMDAHALDFPDSAFDVVVCCEMLEHDPAFWLSLAEMGRVLCPGGRLVVTARGNGFPEHRFPEDHWRFMPDSAKVLASLAGCVLNEVYPDDPEWPGVLFIGVRR
jgi:SAM-dependent methyltransferase